jgi:hypothetical protein
MKIATLVRQAGCLSRATLQALTRRRIVFNLMDPATFWLNVTNIALGLGVLICCLILAQSVWQDVAERLRSRSPVNVKQDSHTLLVPELGFTMADGGEKLKPRPGEPAVKGNAGKK